MSSIQFNYFADEKGELIIRKELLNKFSPLYIRDYSGYNKDFLEGSIENITDFIPFEGKRTLLTTDKEKEQIIEDEDRFVSKYISPIIEYTPSKIRDENIYVEGRLAYFGANEFPEFKKEVESLFRKLKKQCWKDKYWKSLWVFETIGDEATVFIPNRVVHLKKG